MKNKIDINGDGNIVIQDSSNSEIIIHLNKPEELDSFLKQFQNKLDELPKKILDHIETFKETSLEKANKSKILIHVFNSFDVETSPFKSSITNRNVEIIVSITNTSRVNQYFYEPIFNVSPTIQPDGINAFQLINPYQNVKFPFRLEYGEVLDLKYPLASNSKQMFEKIKEGKLFCTIKTSLDERYISNEIKINQILECFDLI